MRLFDVLFAKSLSGGSQPTDDWNVMISYRDNVPSRNSSIIQIKIGEGVQEIPADTFNNANSLSMLSLPNTLESIGDRAFGSCNSLTYVKIPESITYIGEFASRDHPGIIVDLTDFDGSHIPICFGNAFLSTQSGWSNMKFLFQSQLALDAFVADRENGWYQWRAYFEVET